VPVGSAVAKHVEIAGWGYEGATRRYDLLLSVSNDYVAAYKDSRREKKNEMCTLPYFLLRIETYS
jgi:hypothetical protein